MDTTAKEKDRIPEKGLAGEPGRLESLGSGRHPSVRKVRIRMPFPPTQSSRLQALRYLTPFFLILSYFAGSSGVSICIFYSLTGIPCPGCGMTRSVHFFLHGDILHALQYHPFGILLLPALFLVTATLFSRRATALYERWEKPALKAITPVLIVMLLFAAFRAAVLYASGSDGGGVVSWLSGFSALFAPFDEPGLLDFLSSEAFRIGSF